MVCIESVKYCAKRAADACASFDLTASSTLTPFMTPTIFDSFVNSNKVRYDEHCERAAKQGFKALTYDEFLDVSIQIWNS